MDIEKKLEDIIPPSMIRRGQTTIDALLSPIKDLLNRRKFPSKSFSDNQIEMTLQLLSSMDSDKDPEAARVGEREGRIASPIVGTLAAQFNHGIGRSGHLTAPQPKAVGASYLQQIANQVAVDAIRSLGLGNIKHGLVTPISTGMTIGLALSALRRELGIKKVLFPRIDHTSPKRGIALSALEEIQVPTLLEDDEVHADIGSIEQLARKHAPCAVLATTTFFPPRCSDPIKEIAKICATHDIPFVINNAYGVQSEEIMAKIASGIDAGRVDVIIQSSDKNFLSPVGASVVVSPKEDTIEMIAETYAGRATAAPIYQTLASLLSLGLNRYAELRTEQKENLLLLREKLNEIAQSIEQRVLAVDNPVACAMTLDGFDVADIGARLYNRRVTGPRAIEKGVKGSCIDDYPHSYIVMNAAIGASRNDVESATTKLYKEITGHT
ncbi:MAG: O-phosphoseryl-tRNA(Sec) selenium transferase [Candidatus Thorarchaeota archaeon]|jgi:O-phospho-L-seryl-tRNASec:L-selenocysteinyl-tRNA synthase